MALAARKINLGSEKRLEEVTLSLDGKRLIFLFENREGYSILRSHLPRDDGSPITSIQIFDHQGAVAILQTSGASYDLPWDSIKHYAQGGRQKKYSLGPFLKKIREQKGLTQQALAKQAGISRMQLSRLESNCSSPTLDTLLKLSRTLGVTSGIPFHIV